jgi:hypothetical protein
MTRLNKKRSVRKRHDAMKWIKYVRGSHARWTILGSSRYKVYDMGVCRYVTIKPEDTRAEVFVQMTFNAGTLSKLMLDAFRSGKINSFDKEALKAVWNLISNGPKSRSILTVT